MRIRLEHPNRQTFGEIVITGSKSESNRLLILQALYPQIKLENISNSDDTKVTKKALDSKAKIIDINHAGTAMRFLTAYFSSQTNREILLTGSERMQERPIKILVDALKDLGAEITYKKNNGYPPLVIKGKKIIHDNISLPSNVSSQYITALMLIAPTLKKGLKINLVGMVTSAPYIKMTQLIMDKLGFETFFKKNQIKISPAHKIESKTLKIESDWSSASYFYSIAALSNKSRLILKTFNKISIQGDANLSKIYRKLGVETSFDNGFITLLKISNFDLPNTVNFDLSDTPDIAQTIAISCLGLSIGCTMTGLHTLKVKETDRLAALKNEMEKLGAKVEITNQSLKLHPNSKLKSEIAINTYNDHRMAMAFAPLALKIPLIINDSNVVTKSYPAFWDDLKTIKFSYVEV